MLYKYKCLKCGYEEENIYPNAIIHCNNCYIIMETEKDYEGYSLKKREFPFTQRTHEIATWYITKVMEARFGRQRWMEFITNPFKLKVINTKNKLKLIKR